MNDQHRVSLTFGIFTGSQNRNAAHTPEVGETS